MELRRVGAAVGVREQLLRDAVLDGEERQVAEGLPDGPAEQEPRLTHELDLEKAVAEPDREADPVL
ncbi:MAG: hypothetical protein ACK55I_48890, partial [bacterium]